ncbi:hypothetical protein BFV96_2956 [Alteromonas macleodii]|nr:hypothetical protein BFV96_2956 [Alteromonas macleodii]
MTVLLLVFFGDNEEACCSLVVFSLLTRRTPTSNWLVATKNYEK